jgi:hypothetical protein
MIVITFRVSCKWYIYTDTETSKLGYYCYRYRQASFCAHHFQQHRHYNNSYYHHRHHCCSLQLTIAYSSGHLHTCTTAAWQA